MQNSVSNNNYYIICLPHEKSGVIYCYFSVPAFEATQYLITNGEFLEFVEKGGYKMKELWSEEGDLFTLSI